MQGHLSRKCLLNALAPSTGKPILQALPPVVVQSQGESEEDATDPAKVATAEELVSAVARGRRHIRLVDHVDLKSHPSQWQDTQQRPGFVPWTTRSITVRPST